MSTYLIERGDVREVLNGYQDCVFDALFCDPPYGLSFLGKGWDHGVPGKEVWAECLRVLKPGAPLLAFGGTRTFHRLACAIEDAGFEIRDCLTWLYAKGFPKSQDIALAIDKAAGAEREVVGMRVLTGNAAVSLKDKGAPATELAKIWDGWGTALKPGWEPIILARKPLAGKMAENVARWGVGGLAIDACRLGDESITINRWADGSKPFGGGAGHPYAPHESRGRWPPNVLLDEGAAEILDVEVGPRISGKAVRCNGGGNQIMTGIGGVAYKPKPPMPNAGFLDGKTNPSRFFFTAKVSTKEREAGCEHLPKKSAGEVTEREDDTDGLNSPRAGAGRTGGARNHHPTLKLISLTTWLATLIKPPSPGAILVPFSGAGSEMIGCLKAGWDAVVGIERDLDDEGKSAGYINIAQARLRHWCPESEGT